MGSIWCLILTSSMTPCGRNGKTKCFWRVYFVLHLRNSAPSYLTSLYPWTTESMLLWWTQLKAVCALPFEHNTPHSLFSNLYSHNTQHVRTYSHTHFSQTSPRTLLSFCISNSTHKMPGRSLSMSPSFSWIWTKRERAVLTEWVENDNDDGRDVT